MSAGACIPSPVLAFAPAAFASPWPKGVGIAPSPGRPGQGERVRTRRLPAGLLPGCRCAQPLPSGKAFGVSNLQGEELRCVFAAFGPGPAQVGYLLPPAFLGPKRCFQSAESERSGSICTLLNC